MVDIHVEEASLAALVPEAQVAGPPVEEAGLAAHVLEAHVVGLHVLHLLRTYIRCYEIRISFSGSICRAERSITVEVSSVRGIKPSLSPHTPTPTILQKRKKALN